MPAIVSHWLMGKRILKDEHFAHKLSDLNTNAFLWGCQGPDILFYHRKMPWQSGSLSSYGAALHSGDPNRLLRSLAKVCRYCSDRQDYDVIYSYAMGFCSHYCYDRLVHPLVHYNMELLEKTDERGSNYKYHNVIESNYDIMLLRHDTGGSIGDMNLNDCLPACEGIDAAAALIYSLLLCDLYGVHTPRKSAITLASDYRYMISLCNDSHFVKKPVAEVLERLLPYVKPGIKGGVLSSRFRARAEDKSFDYGNMTGSVWFEPKDKSIRSNLSFFGLTDLALADSKHLIELFGSEVALKGRTNFEEFTDGINFGGIKWNQAGIS